MEHTVPQSHLGLLQAIFRELALARDPDATFVDPVVKPEADVAVKVIGQE